MPGLIRAKFLPALRGFLDASDMDLGDFSGFIMHPAGAKMLKTIQKLLRLSRGDLAYSWEVLRDFGEMSSPTTLLVHAGARGGTYLQHSVPACQPTLVAMDLLAARPGRAGRKGNW